ncbi:MAG: bifunctional metallophosphatase/5'-nucleotidase [Ardenticatenaceae bacterium]|nr:bifunctional metallophosphatase/5'-nucleotidase [Ardenticatenaceae bacterium]
MRKGLFVLLLLLGGCQPSPIEVTPTPELVVTSMFEGFGAVEEAETAVSTPTALPILPTQAVAEEETAVSASNTIREISILYTNDEHGWMLGTEKGAGAANLLGLWQEVEGYQPNGSTIILSGGDMWTGPAISTWFQGESMAQVMNQMGYAAAAVGNHEFDFGLDVLRQRAEESSFPFVSANIRRKSDGSVPTDLGIQPYVLQTVNEVVVGIIGLTTTTTPVTTNPVNVSEFEFIDYATALEDVVPQAKAAGAELILVPAHICRAEVMALAQQIGALGVHLLGGGHCNELFAETVNGMVVLESGGNMGSYAWATLQFDTATDEVVASAVGVRQNQDGVADAGLAETVGGWETAVSAELDVVIGYSENGLEQRGAAMQNLVTNAWLDAFPTADAAITNLGGFRAPLPPGEITLGGLITVLPFSNVIVDVAMTGKQLRELFMLADGEAAIGGLDRVQGQLTLTRTGEIVDPGKIYHVLVNDFMYAGGDNYGVLAVYDPNAYNTSVDWRQPVIDWLLAQELSAERPLEAVIGNQ